MKQTNRRRIPAAALVAAVLVAVLAGTAVAATRLGRVEVSPMKEDYEDGYRVRGCFESIPAELLSEELREQAAQTGDGYDNLTLDTWDDVEEFLGLHIASNPMLDRMDPADWIPPEEWDHLWEDCFAYRVQMHCSRGMADLITIRGSYCTEEFEEGGLNINEAVFLRVRNPGDPSSLPFAIKYLYNEKVSVEKYVTPSGIEVSIIGSEHPVHTQDGNTFMQSAYEAYFDLNGAFFHVKASYTTSDDPDWTLDMLKQVLDAYE